MSIVWSIMASTWHPYINSKCQVTEILFLPIPFPFISSVVKPFHCLSYYATTRQYQHCWTTSVMDAQQVPEIDLAPIFAPIYWGRFLFILLDIASRLLMITGFHVQVLWFRFCTRITFQLRKAQTIDIEYISLGGMTIVQAYVYFPSHGDRLSVRVTVCRPSLCR